MCRWFTRAVFTAMLGLLAVAANAQSGSFQGPVSGFFFKPANHTIRPLLGVPGATYLGSPVLDGVDAASVSPGGKWALITRSGSLTFRRGLADAGATEVAPEGLIAAVDRVVWNRDGSFALLYSSAGSQLQRVRLSETTVSADPAIDTSSWGQLSSFAVDPTGQHIAFGAPGSGLFLFDMGQAPVQISSMAQPAFLAFDETGRRLYAVDPGQQQIVEISRDSGALEFASLAQPDGSTVTPVGLAVSGGGKYLLLADGAGRGVRVYETGSRSLADVISLDFAPTRLEALSANPSFLLNGDQGREWLLVLDARDYPKIYFVPAGQEEQQ